MDVECHVAGSVCLLWVWVSGTAVKEVIKGFHCGLCARVHLGCQVVESMHGGVIDCSCKVQELACDLLELVLLRWCHGFRVVHCCHLNLLAISWICEW